MPAPTEQGPSPIYGPVKSWRHGWSLGIDPILRNSICSFNCLYCQLGEISEITLRQDVFVPTQHITRELETVDLRKVDIITLSGSGEPTLALNLGEIIDHVHTRFAKPVLVLTNSTWLHDDRTRQRLRNASIVECKLDAATDNVLKQFNRPAADVTLDSILTGIRALRDDPGFKGRITIQVMFMPANLGEAESLAAILADLSPAEIQLNTPTRPWPRQWYLGARGNHGGVATPVDTVRLRTISEEDAIRVEALLRKRTGIPVRSVYRQARPATLE